MVLQIVLVWNGRRGASESDHTSYRELALWLWQRHGPASAAPLLHSVWVNFQPSRGNTILSNDWQLLCANAGAADSYTWQASSGTIN